VRRADVQEIGDVHLAVLDGPAPEASDALFVGRVTGSGSIPTLSRMGGRQPLHTTGVGKALLSTRDAAWLERYFEVPLERETLHSVTDPEVLRAELARARARGYATTREEMTLGNVSVAAPVAPVQGLPPMSTAGCTSRISGTSARRTRVGVRVARRLHDDLRAAR